MYTDFYVDKTNQTYADTLTTFGLARVIQELMFHQGAAEREMRIQDTGNYYHIRCQPGVDENRLEFLRTSPIVLVKAIPTKFYNEEKQPEGIPLVNWDEVTEYLNEVKSKGDNLPPRPEHLDILLTINPEAIQGYNGLLFRWWIVREYQPEIFRLIFDLYSSMPNDVDAAVADWKKLAKAQGWRYAPKISGQQLYNPDQGQGQNEPKADRLNTSKKNKINFWLTEWLRTVGFYAIAMPRLIGDERTPNTRKDRKILVLAPRDTSFADNSMIMSKFQQTMLPDTAVRFDLFAVIRYLRTLLTYYKEPAQQHRLRTLGNVKKNLVAGFFSAFYKKMGQGRSLMNMSFLSFPGWIEVYSEDDARLYLGLLGELGRLVGQLEESHGEEVTLLQCLRDFLSGDDITKFLEFTTSYAGYYIRQSEKGARVDPVSYELVERIVTIMGKTYADIGDKTKYPGFHKIALAISESTVRAQWRKDKRHNTTYEIRYGLNQELTRKAHNAEQFLEALGEFIHTYNTETARARELGRKPSRDMIEDKDITDVLRMIDDYQNPRMVAQLLVAYGYTFMGMRSDRVMDSNTTQEEN